MTKFSEYYIENLQTSPEAKITIADVLEARNGSEVESDRDHEEEEPGKTIVTKKRL